MVIIGVGGFNVQISLYQVGKMLTKCIQGAFNPLSFEMAENSVTKICYLKLSNRLDPVEVVERINHVPHGKKKMTLEAFIPESVYYPQLPRDAQNKPPNASVLVNSQILVTAHMEIMTELQYKYTGLYNLSGKGSHTLLEAIGTTIHDRLKKLIAIGDEDTCNTFKLTAKYRKMHPHFGDFQLILSTLHRLEDAAGAPRTQLVEAELTVTEKDILVVDNIPFTKAQEAITKYTEKIVKKLKEHVGNYDLTSNPEDSPEEAARKKVQTQLTRMMQYLPTIMKQVVTNHFAQDHRKNKYYKMRMYGEPSLPGKDQTMPLLRRAGAQHLSRWKSMYNLLVFEVPFECYPKVMAHDGTNLGGNKLVIRASNVPIYRVRETRKRPHDGDGGDSALKCVRHK